MEESEIGTLVLNGRAFGPEEVRQIQETARLFSKLSRFELAQTLCEHLGWRTPKGQNKVGSCLKALTKLEALGLIEGPARRGYVARPREPVTLSERADPAQPLVGSVAEDELDPSRSYLLLHASPDPQVLSVSGNAVQPR